MAENNFRQLVQKICSTNANLNNAQCIVTGSTALDMMLQGGWYRRPSDIDLIFVMPDSELITRAVNQRVFDYLKTIASSVNGSLRAAYIQFLHPAERVGLQKGNFTGHRVFVEVSDDAKYNEAISTDYYIMNWSPPFVKKMEFEYGGRTAKTSVEIPQKILGFKLARHLTQLAQGAHDVYDISETLDKYSLVDLKDPYEKELFRFHFLLHFACNGLTEKDIHSERLFTVTDRVKPDFHESVAKLSKITGKSYVQILDNIRDKVVASAYGIILNQNQSFMPFSKKEKQYLDDLKKGINLPELLAEDYPIIFQKHPDITAVIKNHPMIVNMMGGYHAVQK